MTRYVEIYVTVCHVDIAAIRRNWGAGVGTTNCFGGCREALPFVCFYAFEVRGCAGGGARKYNEDKEDIVKGHFY